MRDDQLGDGSVVHDCDSCVGRGRRRRIVFPDDLSRGHAYTDHGELGRLYQWEAPPLLPDQAYCYRVTLGGTDLLGSDPSPRFRTLLPTGSTTPSRSPCSATGDQVDETSSNPDQANLMQRIAQNGVSFAVTTGDNAYASGSRGNYGDLVEVGQS